MAGIGVERAATIVEALQADRELGPQLKHSLYLPPATPVYGELDPALPAPLAEGLAARGVERLWSHQVAGLGAARRGRDVLVTTPTASGKSLIFQLPVLERAVRGEPGHALFLYPLKALGQDQRAKFAGLVEVAGLGGRDGFGCEIYDGDTPRSAREQIKKAPPRVVISNPDMLHLGMLGYWQGWAPFLRDLSWVVLDELHTYRGIFGSHFHHVLERLFRLCRAQGSSPVLIASSATAANAGEFARELTGRSFEWIAESGAPREGRHFLLMQPATSPYTLALDLLVRLLGAGLKTIVFTKARRITELLYQWLRQQDPALARRVGCYRSGFLAEERRDIERQLFEGTLDGVISTSALEMGIDVGGLDACVLVGYPGSIMATWQRSGRVGRAGRESITALVALPDALDQYLLDHPDEFVGAACEQLVVDPRNEPISRRHLVCAAAEDPLSRERDRSYLSEHAPVVGELLRESELVESADGAEIYARERRPQRGVSLRGTGASSTIIDRASRRVIGTVDGVRVLHECHPGAIYLHQGRQYLVRELDLDGARVHAEPVRVDYFTTPLTEKETEIREVLDEQRHGPLEARLGRLLVSERVVGFQRKKIQGQAVLDQQALDLPPVRYETVGLWWLAPRAIEQTLDERERHFMGSLHAAEHAAISLFPLHALCDRGDIGGISLPRHPQTRCGCVFIYDGHPGGVGIAARGYRDLPKLLERVLGLLEGCACDDGCPSCVQSPKCGNGNRPLDKAGAAQLLKILLGREAAVEEVVAPEMAAIEPDRGPALEPPGARRFDERGRIGSQESDPTGNAGEDLAPSRRAPDVGEGPAPSERAGGVEPRPHDRERWDSERAFWSYLDEPEPKPLRRADETSASGEISSGARREANRTPAATAYPTPVAVPPAPIRRPATPSAVQNSVLFDLETHRSAAEVGGWGKAYRMRMAIGVVLHLEEGRFEGFGEDRVAELIARLEAADLVIGFNVKKFDYAVLNGYTGIDYVRRLPTLDLLEEVHRGLGRRVGLAQLAEETLGDSKSADGLESLQWVREGRLDLVEDYCRKDVEVLRDLYLFGRRMGYLVYRDGEGRRVRLPVDW